LNNINLSTEQLQIEDEQGRTYVDIITRSSKRIDNLINELLNSSKQGEMSIQPHSLQAIMDESIAAALDRLTLKRIQLNVSYASNSLTVMADAEKLKIAFLNLVINAIEAMEEDTGRLTISIRNDGPEHVVMIEDNGCGISPENFSRLFEPYFTTKRSGLGLGLASALSTFQSHHAFIDVKSKSKVGEGTTFLITFKAAEEKSED
jgi:signal transduction histidine kinase